MIIVHTVIKQIHQEIENLYVIFARIVDQFHINFIQQDNLVQLVAAPVLTNANHVIFNQKVLT